MAPTPLQSSLLLLNWNMKLMRMLMMIILSWLFLTVSVPLLPQLTLSPREMNGCPVFSLIITIKDSQCLVGASLWVWRPKWLNCSKKEKSKGSHKNFPILMVLDEKWGQFFKTPFSWKSFSKTACRSLGSHIASSWCFLVSFLLN